MAKHVNFFNCYSINLHRFLKASGLRYMNKGVHTEGISLKNADGQWNSYSSLKQASEQEGLNINYLREIHQRIQTAAPGETLVDDEGLEFAKRVRNFWIYLVDDELERLLQIWNKTGPKNVKDTVEKND